MACQCILTSPTALSVSSASRPSGFSPDRPMFGLEGSVPHVTSNKEETVGLCKMREVTFTTRAMGMML